MNIIEEIKKSVSNINVTILSVAMPAKALTFYDRRKRLWVGITLDANDETTGEYVYGRSENQVINAVISKYKESTL
jgi:hypothetical protein